LPDGIYLRSVKQTGAKVTVVGYAQSNARVSTLMRNIEASPWLSTPELVEIKLVPVPGGPKGAEQKINEFTLNFLVKRVEPVEVKGAAGPAAKGAPGAPAAPVAPAAPAKAPAKASLDDIRRPA
jgi:type IV pilus assembly protein PilN